MVGIGLWHVLLQESQVLVRRLGSIGGSGFLGSGGSERWLLGVKFGQLGGEVGWEGWGLGGSRGLVASDSACGVGGLMVSLERAFRWMYGRLGGLIGFRIGSWARTYLRSGLVSLQLVDVEVLD